MCGRPRGCGAVQERLVVPQSVFFALQIISNISAESLPVMAFPFRFHGRHVVFTSNRSGHAQVYEVELDESVHGMCDP
jgi:hypothetical protein